MRAQNTDRRQDGWWWLGGGAWGRGDGLACLVKAGRVKAFSGLVHREELDVDAELHKVLGRARNEPNHHRASI